MNIDHDVRKRVLRALHHNVAVVTSGIEDSIVGATVTWFMQTSFEPLLMTLAIRADSHLYESVAESRNLIINLMDASDSDTAAHFFQTRSYGNGKLGDLSAHPHDAGGAILETALAWISAGVIEILARGDHHLVVVEVREIQQQVDDLKVMNLADTNWHYGG